MAFEKIFSNWRRRPQDAVIALIWIFLGLVPSFLLFFWIERNCSLPLLPQKLGWPWLYVDGTPAALIWTDVTLLALFGVVHSLLVIPGVRRIVFLGSHPKNHRALYVIVTGMTCLAILGHWQSTGQVVYSLFDSAVLTSIFSFLLFWGAMFGVYRVGERLDIFAFLGWDDLRKSPSEWDAAAERKAPTEILVTDGIYRHVRHPIYTFTLLAISLTPFMSLDRLLVLTVFYVYILVGYRLEERKLVRNFGETYVIYREKTPALFPNLF